MSPIEGQSTETVYDLLSRASDLPDGNPARLELLETAVRMADSLGDLEAGWEARDELMEAATMGGHPEKTLVAFSWSLAQFDRVGSDYGWDEDSLLWKYKWVLNSLWNFPAISPAQIEAAFSDFADRLVRGGYSPRTLYYFRAKYEHARGDQAAAEGWRALWTISPEDGLSDCSACEAAFSVEHRIAQGQDELALETAQPILTGRLRCAEVPHTTLADLLIVLLRLERFEEAVSAHRRGYKLIRDNPEFLVSSGQHLAFLAYTRNLPEAVKLLERHLPWALETADPDRRCSFYQNALVLTHRLRETGQTHLQLRLPAGFALQPEPDGYSIVALEAYLHDEALEIAQAFDARNGNDCFVSSLKSDAALLERVGSVSLELPATEGPDKNTRKRKP